MKSFAELAFTPAVRALQQEHGSRANYARMEALADPEQTLGVREATFLAAANSFYLATVGETGWPYVQHRGGPAGFLRVLGPTTLGYADFRGNRQYVSAGNAGGNERVALIVMDYPNRRRLKLLGRLRFVAAAAAEPALVRALELPDYQARVEHVALIDVEAFDWNCPQHITERFTRADIAGIVGPLQERIAGLEAELAALRNHR